MSMLNSLMYVAASYGSKYGVKVIPSNRAATDGKNIYTIIDEENPEATWGFLTHESAHCRYTNFGISIPDEFKRFSNANPEIKKANFNTGHFFSLFNGLEDNRIEYSFFQEYPGAFNTFDSMNALLINKGLWQHDPNDNLLDAITGYTALFAPGNFAGMGYPSCRELSTQVDTHLRSFTDLNEKDYMQIKQVVLDSVKAGSTREVIELAKTLMCIMAKLKAEAEESDSEQKGDSSDEQQGQGDSSQQGDSEQKGDSSDEQQSQSDSSQQGGNPEKGKKSFTANYDVDAITENKDKGELVGQFLSSSPTAENIDYSLEVAAKDNQDYIPLSKSDISDRYEEGVNSAGKLLRRISNLLEAKARTRKDIYTSGRKIDRRKLPTIKTGNSRVFSRKREGISSNTAIYVTVDVSGSMNTSMPTKQGSCSRIDVATKALSALSFAVSRQKTSSLAIGAYDSIPYDICEFNQPIAVAKEKLNRLYPSGSTSYVPAMLRGILKLSGQTQKTRKVFIMVTDGVPGDIDKATELVKKIRESNVEVYCIGVDLRDNAPSIVNKVFGNSGFISINNAEQLQNEILHLAHACM
ncbi:MAG: VWA domain-containing protein [Thalassotalea sp.]|nr:VWA domain-containing protein [Thalassotalea sp.]